MFHRNDQSIAGIPTIPDTEDDDSLLSDGAFFDVPAPLNVRSSTVVNQSPHTIDYMDAQVAHNSNFGGSKGTDS